MHATELTSVLEQAAWANLLLLFLATCVHSGYGVQLLLFGELCPEKHRELEPTRPRKQGNDGKTGSGPGKGQGVLLAGGD